MAHRAVSATNSGVARTVARGPHIGELFPAHRHFGQQPSNPRAEVRLLPGPSRLFMRDPVCDAGYMGLRGVSARPLKTAGDRLSEARTGAQSRRRVEKGLTARHSRPELTALPPQQQRGDLPCASVGQCRDSIAAACGPGYRCSSGQLLRSDRPPTFGPFLVGPPRSKQHAGCSLGMATGAGWPPGHSGNPRRPAPRRNGRLALVPMRLLSRASLEAGSCQAPQSEERPGASSLVVLRHAAGATAPHRTLVVRR
jgi:hypothetical protein